MYLKSLKKQYLNFQKEQQKFCKSIKDTRLIIIIIIIIMVIIIINSKYKSLNILKETLDYQTVN